MIPTKPRGRPSGTVKFPDLLRNVRLPEGWLAALKAMAAGEGITLADIVRRAIKRELGK